MIATDNISFKIVDDHAKSRHTSSATFQLDT